MRNASMLVALGAVLLCTACAHSQKSSTTSTTTTQSSPAAAAPSASPSTVAMNGAAASVGATVFATNCSSCHQASGKGLPGTFPPLAGNAVVTGDPAKVVHIVKDGLTGAIVVNGTTYNGQMPAWGQTLSTNDLAAVITYIRSSWGNHASAVTTAQVSATP
jgi:mono/diheme cytochrome c family protein